MKKLLLTLVLGALSLFALPAFAQDQPEALEANVLMAQAQQPGFEAVLLAQATIPNTATLAWSRPLFPDGTPIPTATNLSYNIYQAIKGVATKIKVGTVTALGGAISTGLASPNEYCWEVTAFITGQEATTESARSNEACKSFGRPGQVTVTVT